MLVARFDGACEPNPQGHAACACLITLDNNEIYRESKYLGFGAGMTNNVSEFEGLMLIMKWAHVHGARRPLTIIGDSQIVIRRMSGQSSKPPVGVCAGIAIDCRTSARFYDGRITYIWQRREHNDECNAMCNLEIEEAMSELLRRQRA